MWKSWSAMWQGITESAWQGLQYGTGRAILPPALPWKTSVRFIQKAGRALGISQMKSFRFTRRTRRGIALTCLHSQTIPMQKPCSMGVLSTRKKMRSCWERGRTGNSLTYPLFTAWSSPARILGALGACRSWMRIWALGGIRTGAVQAGYGEYGGF